MLNNEQIAIAKGMLLRGDKQHDIAAYFGVNGGRIAEINTGKRGPEVLAAPSVKLPPPGPVKVSRDVPVQFNHNNKFDFQLAQGQIAEKELAELLTGKVEVKSESYLWRRSGNICVEYSQRGKPSGIAVTEAPAWAHILKDDTRERTLAIILFPIERLRELCATARRHENGGDGGRFGNYLVRIMDIFK